MGQPLSVDPGGVKSLGQIHDQVSAAVSQLTGLSPSSGDAEAAYGTISSAFTSALGAALPSRDGTFAATSTSSETIGKLLQAAAQAYERGDQANAEKLKAAAEALAGSSGTGGGASGSATGAGGAGAAGAGSAGGGGAEMAGQMASQVGQQVGQIAQGMAQSVQGLAQGLTQLPQQIMQGVQGMVESATKSGAGSDEAKADEAKSDEDKDKDAKPDEKRAEEQRSRQAPPAHTEGAQPGRATDGGRAPVLPPAAERPQPAQTRPQQSPL
jgi:hypothetical protein